MAVGEGRNQYFGRMVGRKLMNWGKVITCLVGKLMEAASDSTEWVWNIHAFHNAKTQSLSV